MEFVFLCLDDLYRVKGQSMQVIHEQHWLFVWGCWNQRREVWKITCHTATPDITELSLLCSVPRGPLFLWDVCPVSHHTLCYVKIYILKTRPGKKMAVPKTCSKEAWKNIIFPANNCLGWQNMSFLLWKGAYVLSSVSSSWYPYQCQLVAIQSSACYWRWIHYSCQVPANLNLGENWSESE